MSNTYTVSKNPATGRQVITLNASLPHIPFNVWRDIGRLAGESFCTKDSVVYEFVIAIETRHGKKQFDKALEVLSGALWEKVDT